MTAFKKTYRPTPRRSPPTFELFASNTFGVDNLDASLTINSESHDPTFRYKGGDASASGWNYWGYGQNLIYVAGTAADYNQGSPLLGDNDDSVKFNDGAYFRGSTTAFADITTHDFVLEVIFKADLSADNGILRKRSATGYQLSVDATNERLEFVADGSSSQVSVYSANNSLVDGCWYHMLLFYDKSGSAIFYLNAANSGSAADVSGVGTLTISQQIRIGQDISDGGLSTIAYVAMWRDFGWLDTHAQRNLAQERFEKLTGLYAANAHGATKVTTVRNRNTVATIDKLESGVRKIYKVGPNWMRMVEREDSNSDTIQGYLSESEGINRADYSEDFSQGRSLSAVTISTDATASPGVDVDADAIAEDNADSDHYITDSSGSSATAGDTVIYSVFMKAANKTWASLYFQDVSAFDTEAYVYFDLGNGEIGDVEADGYGMEDWGNGWYRCWIAKVADNSSGVVYRIYAAEDNGTTTFAGATQDSIYVWGDQLEFDVSYPTSYIPVSGTSDVTRNKDELRYKGDDGSIVNTKAITISCNILTPEVDTSGSITVVELSDGGSVNDRIRVQSNTSDKAGAIVRSSGESNGSLAGTTDITDNEIHEIKVTGEANNLRLYVDGEEDGVADTDVGIPDDLDRINITADAFSNPLLNGVISDLKIYDHIKR